MSLISDRAKAMLGKLAFNDADIEMMKNEPSLKTSAWDAPMRKEDIIGKGLVGFPNSEIIDATEAYLYPDMDLGAWQAGGPMGQITVRLEDGREVTLHKRFDNLQLYDRTAAKTADESDPAHVEVSDDTEAMWPWEIDEVEEVDQLTSDPAVASLNVWGQNRRSIEVVTPKSSASKTAGRWVESQPHTPDGGPDVDDPNTAELDQTCATPGCDNPVGWGYHEWDTDTGLRATILHHDYYEDDGKRYCEDCGIDRDPKYASKTAANEYYRPTPGVDMGHWNVFRRDGTSELNVPYDELPEEVKGYVANPQYASKTAAADETEPIARWESAGGRWWVSLFRSGDEVYYRAVGAGGSLGNVSDEEAIANIEARLGDFQADANVTPMHRVALNPQSGHGESDLETPEIPNEHDPTPMWEWEIDELESEARLDKGVDDDLFL